MSTIDELVVRIRADSAQLQAELKKASQVTQNETRKMAESAGGLKDQLKELIPAITIASMWEFGKRAIETAGHIKDLADRIGFSAGTLSALEVPLAAAGSGLDEFAAGMNRLNDTLGNAINGNQEAIKSFDAVGLSIAKLERMTPEQRFYEVAKALGKITDQSKLTAAGQNLMGKVFAVLQPTLKEHNFNVAAVVDAQGKLGESLGPEAIDKLDNFGDAMTRLGIKMRNEFLKTFADAAPVLQAYFENLEHGISLIANLPQEAHDLAYDATMGVRNGDLPAGASYARPKTQSLDDMQAQLNKQLEAKGLVGGDATGSNAGLLNANPAQEYLEKLRQQNSLLQMSEREAAAAGAEYDLRNMAAKDRTIGLNDRIIAQARELAKANYDLAHKPPVPDPDDSELLKYIQNLQDETDSLFLNTRAKAENQAVDAAKAAALSDYNAGLRDTKELNDEEIAQIRELAGNYSELSETMAGVHDAISGGLTDIILHFNDASDAAKEFAANLAAAILKKGISDPLADTATGFLGKLDIGKLLGFADGGDPPVGVPSIVGEEGPELFVPKSAGTIIPNDKLGGQTITVVHNWNISPGIAGTVRAELASAIPGIVSASTQSVFNAIKQGGNSARAVGRLG